MNWDEEDLDADREASRLSFHAYVKRAWPHSVKGPFSDGRHIAVIAEELEAVTRGEVDRLAINIPPGFGKSWLASVLWPSWEWGPRAMPRLSYVAWTYADHLARRDAERMQTLCASDWYRLAFPHVGVSTTDKVTYFRNAAGGFRFSTTVGGILTGEHGNRLVIDDPNPADASASDLARTEERYRSKTGTRGRPGHARVLIMQRLADRDLTGFLLEQGWRHVRLAMRAEKTFSCPGGKDHACRRDETVRDSAWTRPRVEGELLWPEQFPEKEVAGQEKILGPTGTAAQLQQRPSPLGGAVFHGDWMVHRWKRPLPIERLDFLMQSWDCTFKGSDGSDWVVGGVIGWWKAKAHLLEVVRGRWGFVDTCEQVRRLSARYPRAGTKIVEDAANGAAVCDALENEIPGLQLVRPQGGKLARANATTGLWAAGDVLLPPDDWRGPNNDGPPASDWLPGLIHRHLIFRGVDGQEDDEVDMISQALIYIRDEVGWLIGMQEVAAQAR